MNETLTLLGTAECKLCHEMAEVVRQVIGGRVALREEDVRADPERHRLYRYDIPVLLCGNEEVARHRVTESELRERLARLGVPVQPTRPSSPG